MRAAVGVLMRFFNYEKFIRQAVETVLAQDFKDLNINILCGPSTDRTIEICQEYARTYPNIRVVVAPDNDLIGAWPDFVDGVESDLIFDIDGDDLLPPDAIGVLYRRFLETDADTVTGRTLHRNEAGEIYTPEAHQERVRTIWGNAATISLVGPEQIIPFALKSWAFPGEPVFNANWGHIFRKEQFVRAYRAVVDRRNEIQPTDFEMFLSLLRSFRRVELVNRPTYYYSVHNTPINTSSYFVGNPDYLPNRIAIYNDIVALLKETLSYTQEAAEKAAGAVVIRQFLGNFIYNFRHCNDENMDGFRRKTEECVNSEFIQKILRCYEHAPGNSRLIPFLMRHKLVGLTAYVCRKRAEKRYQKNR